MLGKRELSVSATSLKRSAITILCVLGVCALVFLIYSNALHSEFQFDDKQNIQENEHIRLTGISWQGLLDAGFRSHAWQRPIPNITFALNYYFHGYDTFGYHLVNVIIHLISGLFLFLTVRETVTIARQRNQSILITDSTNILLTASAVAMIWLVHPLATQSVTYVVQRMASMAAMFSIVSMYCYIRARMVTGRMTMWMMYVGCMIAWFLALGSKQISATLPFFIFLYEWYFFRDLDVSWMKRQLVPVMFLAAAGAAVMVLYLGKDPLQRILTFYEVRDFTPIQRVMTEWRVVIMYLGLIIFPHPDRLNLDYDFPLSLSLMNPPTTLLSLLVIIGLLGASVWIAKRERVISFAVFWYFGNLVIESSIIPAELVYEHRTYMPSMFMVLVAVLAAFRLLKPRWAQILFLCVVVATFSVWTYQRNLVWQSDLTLWTDVLKKSPGKARPYTNYGFALMKRDRLDEAIPYFEKSVELAPNFPAVYRNLGHALSRKGRLDEAIEQYRHAVALMPGEISFILELGALLEKKGDLAGAAEVYQGARDRVEVVSALGRVLAQQGKYEEALASFRSALEKNPGRPELYLGMGNIYVMQGRIDEARSAYDDALRRKPDYAAARSNLGDLAMKTGDTPAAIRHYEQALSAGQGPASLLNRLAQAHAAQGDYARATTYLEQVRDLQPDSADVYYNLACMLARQGRVDEAIRNLELALAKGFDKVNLLHTDPDLEAVRKTERFKALRIHP